MKKVSFIIPVYNQEVLVRKTIESIPVQEDIEIIAIDDCSTDNSFQVISEYPNVRAYKNEVNLGAGATRNKGLEYATGEYIIFIDSDDYFYTDKLLEFINLLDGSDIIYYGLIENDGVKLLPTKTNNHILCGTLKAVRREFIGDSRYAEANFAEDWVFNDNLLKKNPTMKFTDLYVLHYNHPREGSLFDIAKKNKKSL